MINDEEFTFEDLVLPNDGNYVVFRFVNGVRQGPRRSYVTRKEDLEPLILSLDQQPSVTIYYSTASLLVPNNEAGNRHSNVHGKACLHIDIDVGHHGFVLSKAEALAELFVLCDTIKIPTPSVIVSSGSGIHAYWSFVEPFAANEMSEWQHLAMGLAAAAEKHAPKITKDTSKWTDRTSLLRWPGTYNKKKSPATPVEEIGGTYMRYARYRFDALKTFVKPPKVLKPGRRAINPVDAVALREKCQAIAKVLDAPSVSHFPYLYLTWYAYHTTEGTAWLHRELKGKPKYDAQQIEDDCDRYAQQHEAGVYRPASCATFCASAGINQDETCRSCPLYKAGKNPIALTAIDPVPQIIPTTDISKLISFAKPCYTVPNYINSGTTGSVYYNIGNDGRLYIAPGDDDNGDVKGGVLFDRAWWCTSRYDDANGKTYYDVTRVMKVEPTRDNGVLLYVPSAVDTVKFPSEAFSDPKIMMRALAAVGIHNELAENLPDFKKRMQQMYIYGSTSRRRCMAVSAGASSFGWQRDGRFVIGKGAIYPDGTLTEYSAMGDLHTAENYQGLASRAISPNATILGAIGALKSYCAEANPLGRALLLAAIATPMFKLFDMNGFVLLLAGQSGKGKTSLQRLMSCVYSAPNASMITGRDTEKSWAHTLSLYGTIPVTFDEFTRAGDSQDDGIKDRFVFGITDGRTKKAMTSDQRQVGGSGSWQTLVFASTNLDYISSLVSRDTSNTADATLSRMSQILIDGPIIPQSKWLGIERQFLDNHGMIGALFISNLMARREYVDREIDHEMKVAIETQVQEARYKAKLLAAMLVTNKILKASNICDFKLSGHDIAELLELHRFKPNSTPGEFNRDSVTVIGSDTNMQVMDVVLMALQEYTLVMRENSPGSVVPIANMPVPRKVMSTSTDMLNGEKEIVIATAAIKNLPILNNIPGIHSILGSLPKRREPLTVGMAAVECIRIYERKDGSLSAEPTI